MDRRELNKPKVLTLGIPKGVPKGLYAASRTPKTITIPPLNAVIASSYGRPPKTGTKQIKLFAVSKGSELPRFVNWAAVGTNEIDDPNKVIGTKLKNYRISPAFEQMCCGSCWAVSTATAFADRYGIANDQVPVTPNILSIMVCCTGDKYNKKFGVVPTPDCNIMSNYSELQTSDGSMGMCSGGIPYSAALSISRNGLPATEEQTYTKSLIDCSAGSTSTQLNHAIIMKYPCEKDLFSGRRIHMDSEETPVYISSSLESKGPPEHYVDLMKKALLDGPLVAGIMVTADFIGIGTDPGKGTINWDSTGKVYVPGAYNSYKAAITVVGGLGIIRRDGRRIDDAPMGTGIESLGNIMCGFHAIVIVGYGELDIDYVPNKTVKFVTGKDGRKKLPYWVCRNSWGPQWPPEGYYKSGIRTKEGGKEHTITVPPGYWLHAAWPNDSLAIDVPIVYNGSDYGATMVMTPAKAPPTPQVPKATQPPQACNTKWRDSEGYSCKQYGEQRWCTKQGTEGPGWRKEWGRLSDFGKATEVCCECKPDIEGFSGQGTQPAVPVVLVVLVVLMVLVVLVALFGNQRLPKTCRRY